MGAREREAWVGNVLHRLRRWCGERSEVVILAGQNYRQHLEPVLRSWGCEVTMPLLELGMGQQLQ